MRVYLRPPVPSLVLLATGALFRAYPGPWQVLRRNPVNEEDMRVVWTGDKRPSLKQVALEILPNS
jgi:hypothetical protein